MAEPPGRSGQLQIQIDYSFDRLCESKLAQAYSILVPSRERPVGGQVKESEDENGNHLCSGFVRAEARGNHDSEANGGANPVRSGPRSGGAQRLRFRSWRL